MAIFCLKEFAAELHRDGKGQNLLGQGQIGLVILGSSRDGFNSFLPQKFSTRIGRYKINAGFNGKLEKMQLSRVNRFQTRC